MIRYIAVWRETFAAAARCGDRGTSRGRLTGESPAAGNAETMTADTLKSRIFLSLAILVICLPAPLQAQEARLTNLTVTNNRDDLLLFLNVEGAFREKIKKAVLSGAPATFSFFINLYESRRDIWADERIAALKVVHTIKYDHMKKEFTVNRSWEGGEPKVTRSFEEAQKWMAEISSLKIVSLGELEKGSQYQIRAKAELSKLTLPLNLHYVLFFVALWDFETDWYTVDFIY
jgi:hypothetical protein